MTTVATADSTAATHTGSSPMQLSGRAVLVTWFVSIFLHILALIVMFFAAFPFADAEESTLPVARAEVISEIETEAFLASPTPDLKPREREPDPLERRFKPNVSTSLAELSATSQPNLPVIGIGVGGADLSKYGLTGGGGSAPEFFGLGRSARGARKIVYVVDRSGSMLDTFGYVQRELQRSISALRRTQKFHVIFFNSGPPLENPPRRLVAAIAQQKRSFYDFLSRVQPDGSTHPEQSMKRALSLEPDVVYFLTDGAFDPGLIDKLNGWNRGRRVKIFTIAFFDSSGADLLQRIAREHGGEFKFVSEFDLP